MPDAPGILDPAEAAGLLVAQWVRDRRPLEVLAFESALESLDAAPRVFTVGAGRSGLVARAFAMRLAQMGIPAHVAGEATAPAIAGDGLLVVYSCSGETPSTLALVQIAERSGAEILAFTSEPKSPISREATFTIQVSFSGCLGQALASGLLLPASSLFEIGAWMLSDALAAALARRRGQGDDDLRRRHANLE